MAKKNNKMTGYYACCYLSYELAARCSTFRLYQDCGQVVRAHVPLSSSNIIW